MRTFAEKPKAAQRTAPFKSPLPGRAHFGQCREVNSILHLHRRIGNQAVQRLLQAKSGGLEAVSDATAPACSGHDFSRMPVHAGASAKIPSKLAVTTPGDIYEKEADHISEQVMRMPEPQSQRDGPCGGACPQCRTEQSDHQYQRLETQPVRAGETGQIGRPPFVHDVLSASGQPLDPATRGFMEQRFDYDFSNVRVHSDATAEQSAHEVSAEAYTVGHDIVFGAGRFAPGTHAGRRLIAHELAHVIQQGGREGTPSPILQRKPDRPGPAAERGRAVEEAEAVANVSTEYLVVQAEAEWKLKLQDKRRGEKNYAWSLGVRDRDRLRKTHDLSPDFQQEITVKVGFFRGEAKAAYIQTIGGALSEFPSEQVIQILEGQLAVTRGGEQGTMGLACDVSKGQFSLLYEDGSSPARCVDIESDPELENNYFDDKIRSAIGFAIEGTTWENVEYGRFGVMLVEYRNGSSDYFLLDDIGNFHYGSSTPITLQHGYLKRTNGLVYPIRNGRLYFNEILTPNLLRYKNGLEWQVRQLQDLYTLLQVAGAHAAILGSYGAGVGAFKASIRAFATKPSTKLPGRPLPGVGVKKPKQGGVPEPITDETPTQPIRVGDPGGEIVGDFRIGGKKWMQGTTFHREIYGLFNLRGKQTDIRPLMRLFQSFVEEAKAAGATELRIHGGFIRNRNVLKMDRFVASRGGTFRVTGSMSIEIVIPLK